MKVVVNGTPQALHTGATVGSVVDGLKPQRRGIAAALNEEVVPRSRWDDILLREGDRVEILTAAQGG